MGHHSVKKKRKGKLHAARDRAICKLRKSKRGWTHSRLAKKFKLTNSRISQILKDGGAMGIRCPYRRPKKPKPCEECVVEPDMSYESPREEAEMRHWARHIPFLNDWRKFEET
jgi:hypothetical protein